MPELPAALDLDQIFGDFPEPVLVADSDGSILLASRSAGRLFGRATGDLAGLPLASLFPDDAPRGRLLDAGVGPVGPLPIQARTARGANVDVEVTVGASRNGLVTIVVREKPASRGSDNPGEIWRYFDSVVRLADGMKPDVDKQDALASILPTMFADLRWDVACLWLVQADGRRMVCAATWPDDRGPTTPFEEASRRIRPEPGEGLPGSSWRSGRPLLSSVGGGERTLLRQEAILACGLEMGVAFPLVTETGVIGVIEAFTREPFPVTLRLLDGLAGIGRQIGRLLDRVQAESRLREQERLSSFLLEAATELSGSSGYSDALLRLAPSPSPTWPTCAS